MSARTLKLWAALCLVAAPLLYGLCWLDTALAGEQHLGTGPQPYAQADAVRFGLSGLRYLSAGQTLTGPHISYPLVLGVLALNTLGLWWARGRSAQVGTQARRMLAVSAAALLLTLGLGWPVLQGAQQLQNRWLAQDSRYTQVRASPVTLDLRRCPPSPGAACRRVTSPNPVAWGLTGLLLTGAAGLGAKRNRVGRWPVSRSS